ncbi:MAG: DMT family transporter [Nanoarchaeota archaeon]|nr:DMT family transporter [Nanoarchaeota archaeon]MBU1030642.1 DMT family transporter [Nanoarchaeota archaeon]MBU1849844.1 DMT family transporter [Nanoarchaeota archaeon]
MKKGIGLVFGTAIISGISVFLNAFGVKDINPFLFTGAKNFLVAICLLSTLILFKNFSSLKKLNIKQWTNLVFIGLIGGSIPFLLFFKGLQLISPAQGSFIHKTMILWVGILALIFLKEKINVKLIVGLIILLAGNFLLLKITSFDLTTGALLVFAATIFWSVEIILSKKLLKNTSGNVLAFGRMFFGSIFIFLYLLFTNQLSGMMSLTTPQLGWIVLTSIFLFVYVTTFYNGLKYIKASTAIAILSLGAVITTILNIIFLDKILMLHQFIGLTSIVVGSLLISLFSEKSINQISQQQILDEW